MRKNKGNKYLTLFLFIFILAVTWSPEHGNALSVSYIEDFSTTTYLDSGNTTANGWGTGTLTLPKLKMELVGSVSTIGSAISVFVAGNFAYVNDGSLRVVNITNPSDPTIVASVAVEGYVYVEGNYAYVSSSSGSTLRVVDISNPASPSLETNTATGGGPIQVSGNYAYCADGSNGMRVVNITDPTSPSLVTTFVVISTAYNEIAVSGNYAYLIESLFVRAVDISDPSSPSLADSITSYNNNHDLTVDGNNVFHVGDGYTLGTIDASDPTNLGERGAYWAGHKVFDVTVEGNYAYMSTDTIGLEVVNITNLNSLTHAGYYNTTTDVEDIVISGEYAYICLGTGGLEVVRVMNPTITPSVVGSRDTNGHASGVFVAGDYLYVADRPQGFKVYDISDTTNPISVGNYSTSDWAEDVFVSGHYAYVGTHDATEVIDISDPSNPTFVGSVSTPTMALGVYVSGDYAYVAETTAGMRVIDISNPAAPSSVTLFDTNGSANDVFVSGDYAYVASGADGLYVIDIKDPNNPILADDYDTPGDAQGVFVDGDYAYVADDTRLRVIDVSDPTNILLVGTGVTPYYFYMNVFVSGDYAYVADISYIRVFNISDPTSPIFYRNINVIDTRDVFVSGDYIYSAAYFNGFEVIEARRNLCKTQYETSAVAQSGEISSISSSMIFTNITLTATASIPSGTSITYYVSPDNGTNWETVSSGVPYVFVNRGNRLKWRAVMGTTNIYKTPSLSSMTLDYKALLVEVNLLFPNDGNSTNNNTPTFSWESIAGASEYLLQIDTSTGFDTGSLVNLTVGSNSHKLSTSIADGTWYWRVAGVDSQGHRGLVSEVRDISVDTTPPSWTQTPTSKVAEFGDQFTYDLNATDVSSALDVWWTNDTQRFSIDSSGELTNDSVLSVGIYWLKVSVNDTFGNTLSAEISIDVQDTTSPNFVPVPVDEEIEFGSPFSLVINATDLSGIDKFWLNDTNHFMIDASGLVLNVTSLEVGLYGLHVYVNDTQSMIASCIFTVNVSDTTAPSWDQIPSDQFCEYGNEFSYKLNASDLSGIDKFWLIDTNLFMIDASGLVLNATSLEVGTHWLHVYVNDTQNVITSYTFTVDVSDSTAPSWDQIPSDQFCEYGNDFSYQLNASDLSDASDWTVNDTSNFGVGHFGYVYAGSILNVGDYGLNVTVTDAYYNTAWAVFTVHVEDTIAPTWTVDPSDHILEYGAVLDFWVEAADLTSISWTINDTVNFQIAAVLDNRCNIMNLDTLNPGRYGLSITASDDHGNSLTAEITIEVLESTTTTSTTTTTTSTTTTSPTGSTTTTTTTTDLSSGIPPTPPDNSVMYILLSSVAGVVGIVVILIVIRYRRQ